jgi:predicted DNA-binding transcriptional regulator AlpA
MTSAADQTINKTPHPVSTFEHLPNEAFVGSKTVKALFGISSTTLWRHVNRGSIPRPHKYSERTTRWNVGELRKALAAKLEA